MVFLCSPLAQIQYIRSKYVTRRDANNWFSINKQIANNTAHGQSKTRSYDIRIASLHSWRFCLASAQMSANERWSYESSRGLQAASQQEKKNHCYCCSRWLRLVLRAASTLSPTKQPATKLWVHVALISVGVTGSRRLPVTLKSDKNLISPISITTKTKV